MSNAIALENAKQGNPESEWGLTNGASASIEGFTTDMSYNLGESVDFKINTDASRYRIDIYRLGYYGGDGARLVGSLQHDGAIDQPDPLRDAATGLVDAGNWSVTDSWNISADLVSGVYIAKLVREDGIIGENHIPFVVRNDAGASDIVLKTADETWQAYNAWGGASLYIDSVAVSYNRPFVTAQGNSAASPQPWNFLFGEEYAAIRWLERNGFDVSYVAGVDLARSGERLQTHQVFLSVGHDEYWSAEQRAAVEAARDAGVNLAFWSGNSVYWKTRWADSIDGSGDDYRTLITYKETRADAKIDPSSVWTGLWRDARFSNGTETLIPENALTGTFYMVDYDRDRPLNSLTVTSEYASMPIWRNTSVARLTAGQSASFENLIGYEWDIISQNGWNPATLIELSSTFIASNAVLQDELAKVVAPGTATHSLALSRAESGALVFGAGTVMWAWGLDDHHSLGPGGTGAGPTASADIQQAMINLFADMGVYPATLQSNLVEGGTSGDVIAPALTPVAAVSNFEYWVGDAIELAGTAADPDNHLAGVIVSGNDGATWKRASGTTDWTASIRLDRLGVHTVTFKAFDTSFNMSAPVTLDVKVSYELSGTLQDFSAAQGWSNTGYKRMFADIDGDGIKDLIGFGQNGTLGYFGGSAGAPGFRTPGTMNIFLADFGAAQGYTAQSIRGVDYLGSFAPTASRAAVIWGQTTGDGITFYVPTAVDATTVAFDPVARTYAQFGKAAGWTEAHALDVGFVAEASTFGTDAYGSIFGFGKAGLVLGRQAFAPGADASQSALVAGSAAFGNDAGWSNVTDLRVVRAYDGNEIDLNRDGIVDVLGVGNQGTIYAFGQLSDDGAGGTIYSLGASIVATNGASGTGSDFGVEQGWSKESTPRFIADVNNDGRVDILGFGTAGVYVSEGRTPAADGTGAFATSYLAMQDYGADSGWSAVEHARDIGDVNGDGILDIIGFGDSKTLVAFGAIDSQSGRISWTLSGLLGDYAISKGWSSETHMRSVVDLNGDGTTEIYASGDFNTRITAHA